MPHLTHPDDELLAALADDEAEAVSDQALAAHVASCDRCGPIVQDLRQLRLALAQLPDIPPSRPLQLIPSVLTAPERRSTRRGWIGAVGWLTGPAMAVGAVLILVGAIGTATSGLGIGAAGAGAGGYNAAAASAGAGGQQFPVLPATSRNAAATPVPRSGIVEFGSGASKSTSDDGTRLLSNGAPGSPWLPVLAMGVALLAVAFLARGYVRRVEGAPGP